VKRKIPRQIYQQDAKH